MEVEKQIIDIYKNKGLNGIYRFLKKNNIEYSKEYFEFGIKNTKISRKKKILLITNL